MATETVKEIKSKLINDFGYEAKQLTNIKKDKLKQILEEESKIGNLDISFGEGEDSGDFEMVEEAATETVEQVEEDIQEAIPPCIQDAEWSDYVLSKFEYDEAIDGNPTVDGLRRVTEVVLGQILETRTEIVQVPTKENQGRATAVCTVTVMTHDNYTRTASGSGDAWHKNTDMPYSKFPVAMAETRAEGRALRRLLQLRKVVAAEELSDSLDDTTDYQQKISDNQVNFIEVFCKPDGRGLNINVAKFINSDSKTYSSIRELDHNTASACIQTLSGYQQNTDSIPENIKHYDHEWRSYFDVSNS
jgi:hypothetical protein